MRHQIIFLFSSANSSARGPLLLVSISTPFSVYVVSVGVTLSCSVDTLSSDPLSSSLSEQEVLSDSSVQSAFPSARLLDSFRSGERQGKSYYTTRGADCTTRGCCPYSQYK
ncbi:hypothetical protein EB796_007604 [Bugula neritina]|uniref:Uncharacterized protein n=1 Tax=Bugula neritina TaxID=10212 RepID=A0A7J7K830_BUGNE|nr:hypothetical protein EB796_007604 [Bugula neritina]